MRTGKLPWRDIVVGRLIEPPYCNRLIYHLSFNQIFYLITENRAE